MELCEKTKAMMSEYIDNELAGDRLAQFEGHISRCEQCRAELARLTGLIKSLNELPEEELPEGFHEEFMKIIAVPKPKPSFRRYAYAAACVLFALAVAGAAVGRLSRRGRPLASQAAGQHLNTPPMATGVPNEVVAMATGVPEVQPPVTMVRESGWSTETAFPMTASTPAAASTAAAAPMATAAPAAMGTAAPPTAYADETWQAADQSRVEGGQFSVRLPVDAEAARPMLREIPEADTANSWTYAVDVDGAAEADGDIAAAEDFGATVGGAPQASPQSGTATTAPTPEPGSIPENTGEAPLPEMYGGQSEPPDEASLKAASATPQIFVIIAAVSAAVLFAAGLYFAVRRRKRRP